MIFWPSGLDRVIKCPGSYLMEQRYPKTTHPSAAEGSAAVKLAEWDLKHNVDPIGCKGTEVFGVTVDNEMIEHVMGYVAYCRSLGGSASGVEDPGKFSVMEHEVTGAPDYWAYSHPYLHIVDFKYGMGWVYPEENWQLLAYAIMRSDLNQPPPKVKLHIYQPRANRPGGPVHTWEFDGELLRNYRNQIQNQCCAAALPNAPASSGEHCRYCRAIIDCTVNQRTAGECLEVSMRSDSYTPEPANVGIELSMIETAMERMKHRAAALEAHGIALIQSGKGLPGYVAEQSMSDLKWVVDAIRAGDEMGVNLRAPEKPMTPTQAKDKKLIAPEMLQFMAKRSPGAFKLKRVDMDAIRRIVNG